MGVGWERSEQLGAKKTWTRAADTVGRTCIPRSVLSTPPTPICPLGLSPCLLFCDSDPFSQPEATHWLC